MPKFRLFKKMGVRTNFGVGQTGLLAMVASLDGEQAESSEGRFICRSSGS